MEYIAAGDIYQVNLTQRFTVRTPLTPLEIHLRLREANASDFAALLIWDERAVICASPELFLSATADGAVLTRPIKGTHARAGGAAADAAAGAALLASAKDRAELNMIIDLLRNDLGRVCAFGSVRVVAEADVEVHPTVLHLVGTVAGQLRPEITRSKLLEATLPGGSITGCPKIRAMQIIRELEDTPRGAYCGAIGYLGLDGGLGLNVAIRTMQYDRGTLHLHAGGAITADSDPNAEYAETLAKAEGMFRALGHSTAALDAAAALR
jgi:anthranilate/para-aminobenzoate synthase component I